MNGVNRTLNLSPDQVSRLNAVHARTQEQYRERYNSIDSVNSPDRWTRLQELNRQYYTDWGRTSREVFNEKLWPRYQQLHNQYGGFDAFYYPDVQTQLNLTAAQLEDLRVQSDWAY